MENAKQQRRPQTKKERIAYLLNCVNKWIEDGETPEDAIGKLTQRQYDFLIDADVDFDSLLLTPKQQRAVQEVRKSERRLKPEGYSKKYPKEKQEIYTLLVETLKANGAEIIPLTRENFRDLVFDIAGERYQIVFSKGGKTAEKLLKKD